ncbi:MAG: glycosyltransferase family 2 protein [Myxococcota bacterium]|jgi:glycosyltransferase involved in cell wall biosynthesis
MPDVILPVLNESEALPWVLARMPDGYRPIVVDNGSTDGSGAIARAANVEVVVERRPGFGSACFAGLSAALDEVVCFMDCDGSLDPGDLPAVSGPVASGSRDLVLGARIAEPGAWPPHARVGNRLIAWEIRRRTGVPLTDLGPMRAARREALLALGIQDRRFGWPFEMVVRAHAADWNIAQVDVPYRARTGRSKVTGTVKGTMRAFADLTKVMR